MSPRAAARPETIAGYLARLGAGQRRALERLRRLIQATAPKAEECIRCGIPAFRLDGRMLVGFGARAGALRKPANRESRGP